MTTKVANCGMPRQAITTAYHQATNGRGSRMSAKAKAGRMYAPYNYELDDYGNHVAIAEAFAADKGWVGELIGGVNADGSIVFVLRDRL